MDITFKFPDSVPLDHIDVQFIQGMIDRMGFGFHNYGHSRRNFDRPNNLQNIEIRFNKYKETGNTEFLMDTSNYCMMEFMVPSIPGASFRPTSREESPGSAVSGRIVKGKDELRKPHHVRQPKEGD